MEYRADHCKTAQDVRRASDAVMHRREISRKVTHSFQPKPVVVVHPFIMEIIKRAEFMPLPEPEPIIALIAADEHPYQITIRDVQRTVSRKFKTGILDLLSKRRSPNIVLPRHISFVLCLILTMSSSAEIGRKHGGRDHSTVLHANEKFQWLSDRLRAELKPTDFLSAWVNRAHELVTEGAE